MAIFLECENRDLTVSARYHNVRLSYVWGRMITTAGVGR